MKLLLAGVSHKTAPVEVRERLAFPEARLAPAVRALKQREGIAEAVILSTCNRVEITVCTNDDCDAGPAIESLLSESFGPYIYRHEGREAIHHLFRVASSLESMIVGEPQILGQMKAAYNISKSEGAVSGLLDNVFTRAFSVAKRVRSETGIGQMAVSVSYAAVELARKIFGSLAGHTVMIAGGGKMSELAARHLRRSGASRIFVTNRTHQRAVELAQLFQGTAIEYSRFPGMLPEIDILIASSGAPHYILVKEDVQRAISARKNKPMFLIDIAVPRNIEPAVNKVDNVFLYDIDDLQGVVNANLRERMKEAECAEAIVAQEVERMVGRLRVQEIAPTIVSLQEQLEEIRAGEVARTMRKLGPLTLEQREAIDALTRSIVNKIAHGPISELRKQASEPEGVQIIETIRRVFHLQD
ncbi:MAG: glutamyl-tRNA reductase [Bryobacteraceae bacterium]